MAIEGPLRELGIHDVFQLLDLSRKTGRLRVTSRLRDNEGMVEFRNGRVITAMIRSNPHSLGQILLRSGKITDAELERATQIRSAKGERRRLGEILVEMGALTTRELERQIRRQIEAVVFELMSWQEGFFTFVESPDVGANVDPRAGLATEALLMEAARRIDEWTLISQRVPSLDMVPGLADIPADVPADQVPMLDLLPNEWEVLAAIDGATDLRTIAATVTMSDFDVARIVYGLVVTGVVVLHDESRRAVPAVDHVAVLLTDARDAMRRGDLTRAIDCWRRVVARDPNAPEAAQAREAMEHATRLVEVTGAP
jgi:hypothetical protein